MSGYAVSALTEYGGGNSNATGCLRPWAQAVGGSQLAHNGNHRCFIGVPVPRHLLGSLRALRCLAWPTDEARPVPEANLHLTLVFIGPLTTGQMDVAASTLETLPVEPLPDGQPLTRAGGFPGPRGRFIVAEGEATPALSALHAHLRAALDAAGLPSGDDRPLRPHITLAKRPRGGTPLPDHSCALGLPVDELILYQSVQVAGGNGVEYRAVARRVLG